MTRTAAETVAYFSNEPLDFRPGEQFHYSNSGYILLGYLIERLTGQSYETFVRNNIFTPLGMADTGYAWNETIIPRRAAGYVRTPDGFVNAEFNEMSIPHGGGALYSTTGDLVRWNERLYGGRLLSAVSLRKMTTAFLGHHAMGIYVEEDANGRRRFEHTGGQRGFTAALTYYPDSGISVAVLANVQDSGRQGPLVHHLGTLAHGDTIQLPSELKAIEVPEAVLADYVGTYESGLRDSELRVTLEGGRLMFHPRTGQSIPLAALSETSFFAREVRVRFLRDERGHANQIVVSNPAGQKRGGRRLLDTR